VDLLDTVGPAQGRASNGCGLSGDVPGPCPGTADDHGHAARAERSGRRGTRRWRM